MTQAQRSINALRRTRYRATSSVHIPCTCASVEGDKWTWSSARRPGRARTTNSKRHGPSAPVCSPSTFSPDATGAGVPRRRVGPPTQRANPDRVACCCWCEVTPKYPGPWSWAPGRGRRGDPSTRRIVMRGREPRGASAVQRSAAQLWWPECSRAVVFNVLGGLNEGAHTVRGESVACMYE